MMPAPASGWFTVEGQNHSWKKSWRLETLCLSKCSCNNYLVKSIISVTAHWAQRTVLLLFLQLLGFLVTINSAIAVKHRDWEREESIEFVECSRKRKTLVCARHTFKTAVGHCIAPGNLHSNFSTAYAQPIICSVTKLYSNWCGIAPGSAPKRY